MCHIKKRRHDWFTVSDWIENKNEIAHQMYILWWLQYSITTVAILYSWFRSEFAMITSLWFYISIFTCFSYCAVSSNFIVFHFHLIACITFIRLHYMSHQLTWPQIDFLSLFGLFVCLFVSNKLFMTIMIESSLFFVHDFFLLLFVVEYCFHSTAYM